MARKSAVIIITDEGRDLGRRYLLTEMPASQAERWAIRAFMGMSKSGVEVPQNLIDQGIVGLIGFGFRAISGMSFGEAQPLLDEMMMCVKHMPNPGDDRILVPIADDNMEEIATRIRIRKEIFELHVSFFTSARQQVSTSG